MMSYGVQTTRITVAVFYGISKMSIDKSSKYFFSYTE